MVKNDKKIDVTQMMYEGMNADGPEMDPNSIPDIDMLIAKTLELLEFLDTDEMMYLEKNDDVKHIQIINGKFDDLPYNIIKLMIDREHRDEHLERLINMFKMLADIKMGKKDIKQGFEDYRESLYDRYLYPQFGGKEGFERAMMEKGDKK